MKNKSTSATGQRLLQIAYVSTGIVFALLAAIRDLFTFADKSAEGDRAIQDADIIGDYNFRTQQFDSGTDPAGWYEDEH